MFLSFHGDSRSFACVANRHCGGSDTHDDNSSSPAYEAGDRKIPGGSMALSALAVETRAGVEIPSPRPRCARQRACEQQHQRQAFTPPCSSMAAHLHPAPSPSARPLRGTRGRGDDFLGAARSSIANADSARKHWCLRAMATVEMRISPFLEWLSVSV